MNLSELDPAIRRAMLNTIQYPALAPGTAGALTVDSSAMDPDVLWGRTPPRDWWALKWGGRDSGSQESFKVTFQKLSAHGLRVGVWLTDEDFPNPVDLAGAVNAAAMMCWPRVPAFAMYDVENWYKANGTHGDGFWRATSLVEAHHQLVRTIPGAVTSYGKADVAMDLDTFVLAGWPMVAQGYDAFTPQDALTYMDGRAGWWPPSAVFPMVRSLHPARGESIYRPESLDP